MDIPVLSDRIPPVGSPHWLTWRHIITGMICIVVAAGMLTACLSDYLESGTPPPPELVLNPDYAATPTPLPPSVIEVLLSPTNEQLNEALYQDDEDLFDEELLNDLEMSTTDIRSRMGQPDSDGFYHPQFDLNDWYLHLRATDLKYRWALSKLHHWKISPTPVEMGRLRVLSVYIKKGVRAFPDPRLNAYYTARDVLRWQAGLEIFKSISIHHINH